MYAIRSYYDFSAPRVRECVIQSLEGGRAGVVMSDMAPNISGMRAVDQARAIQLADDVITSYSIHYTKLYEPREVGGE